MNRYLTQRGEIATLATLLGLTVIVAGMVAGGTLVEYGSRLFSRASTGTSSFCTVQLNSSGVTVPVSDDDDDDDDTNYASVTATVTLASGSVSVQKVEFSVDSPNTELNKTADSTVPYIVHVFGRSLGTSRMKAKAVVLTSVSGVTGSCEVMLPITVQGAESATPTSTRVPTQTPSSLPTDTPAQQLSATYTPSPTNPPQQLLPTPTPFCQDSDTGQVYDTKGVLRSNASGGWNASLSYEDYCSDISTGRVTTCTGSSCRLIEYFCNSSVSAGSIVYPCAGGCQNGVCISSPTPTVSPTIAQTNPGCTISANPSVVLVNVGQQKIVSAQIVLQEPAIMTKKVEFLPSSSIVSLSPNESLVSPYRSTLSGVQAGTGTMDVRVTVADASDRTGTCEASLSVTVTNIPSPTSTGVMQLQPSSTPTASSTTTPTSSIPVVTVSPTVTSSVPVPTVTCTPLPPCALPGANPVCSLAPIPNGLYCPPPPTRTPTPTPSLSQSSECSCVIGNACHHSCAFVPMSQVRYANPFRCAPPFSNRASDTQKTDWCRRQLRTSGDADGKDGVNLVDYDYYRRTVLLDANIPEYVNADYSGDGEVGTIDATIVLKYLRILP